MPQFTVTNLTRCAGQNHYDLTITVGGQSRTITLTRSDLALEPEDFKDAFLHRIRSAVKEAGANTFAQAQAALVGQTFQI